MSDSVETFTTRMRKATRKIHSVSDALVNAKFAISLGDETVWGGGIFIFYHVFAYLEDAKERLKMPDFNKLFVHDCLYRKKAFEADLAHYLGDDWQNIQKAPELEKYLEHLQTLEKQRPELLMAYVYHLYLGLLSGGQILSKKRKTLGGEKPQLSETYTDKVTDFSGVSIPQLKDEFRKAMNEIADKMTDEEKQAFLDESNQVFILNNSIVKTVGGQNKVIRNILTKIFAATLVVGVAIMTYKVLRS